MGVQRIAYDHQTREYLTVQYSGEDRLYVPVSQIDRFRDIAEAVIMRLSCRVWVVRIGNRQTQVKKSVKQVAEDLINLYAMRASRLLRACLMRLGSIKWKKTFRLKKRRTSGKPSLTSKPTWKASSRWTA